MFHVILVNPQIPGNTGNTIRLCANTGSILHLVHPLGFSLADSHLRRAGLDYHDLAHVREHADLDACLLSLAGRRVHVIETGGAQSYAAVRYAPGDALLFGCETAGLDAAVLGRFASGDVHRIPMRPGNRSLNLSNAVALVVYEAWRQNHFASPSMTAGADE
jgi:tRNA (cytidine/uridine-2'-O-)-methyltransferase